MKRNNLIFSLVLLTQIMFFSCEDNVETGENNDNSPNDSTEVQDTVGYAIDINKL